MPDFYTRKINLRRIIMFPCPCRQRDSQLKKIKRTHLEVYATKGFHHNEKALVARLAVLCGDISQGTPSHPFHQFCFY